jgi:hypothetical protein
MTDVSQDNVPRAMLERLQRIERQCALTLADARRVEAATRSGAPTGPWLACAGDLLDEMDEILTLTGSAATSAARDRVASLRRELHLLESRAADHNPR